MKIIKIKDIVDIFDDSTAGIFHALKGVLTGEGFEWLQDDANLDLMYYINHSGEKYASPFYLKMLDANKTISDVANVLKPMFSDKWKRIYQAMMMEYNPINNYDMKEVESVNSKVVNTIGTKSEVYGFGGPNAAPSDEASSTSITEGDAKDNVRKLTRSGNIGVTTSAQLLEGEIEVRRNLFIDLVMNDIDSIMCLKLY